MAYSDEDVPLLPQSESELSRFRWKSNPLPWPQLSAVLFVEVCDGLAAQSIKPYIYQVRTSRPRRARLDLSVSAACWWAGHHWGRRAQSRVLCWADRESQPSIFGAGIYASFESSTTSLGVLLLYRIDNDGASLEQTF